MGLPGKKRLAKSPNKSHQWLGGFLLCSQSGWAEWNADFVCEEECSWCQQTRNNNKAEAEKEASFRVLQWKWLASKIPELSRWMKKHRVGIAAIQQTKITKMSSRWLAGIWVFVMVRKDRVQHEGGGLMFIIHKNLQYTVLEVTEDQQIEH